jgi:hypothetical protein
LLIEHHGQARLNLARTRRLRISCRVAEAAFRMRKLKRLAFERLGPTKCVPSPEVPSCGS